MGPEQVRATLLEDHARLRLLFQELDGAARRVLTGDALLAFRMRVLAEALREQVLAHPALEDRLLLPVAGLLATSRATALLWQEPLDALRTMGAR